MANDIYGVGKGGLVGPNGKELKKVMDGEVSMTRQVAVLKEVLARQAMETQQVRAILAAVVRKDGGSVTLCAADLSATQAPGFALGIKGNQETGEMRLETFVQTEEPATEPQDEVSTTAVSDDVPVGPV